MWPIFKDLHLQQDWMDLRLRIRIFEPYSPTVPFYPGDSFLCRFFSQGQNSPRCLPISDFFFTPFCLSLSFFFFLNYYSRFPPHWHMIVGHGAVMSQAQLLMDILSPCWLHYIHLSQMGCSTRGLRVGPWVGGTRLTLPCCGGLTSCLPETISRIQPCLGIALSLFLPRATILPCFSQFMTNFHTFCFFSGTGTVQCVQALWLWQFTVSSPLVLPCLSLFHPGLERACINLKRCSSRRFEGCLGGWYFHGICWQIDKHWILQALSFN